LRTLCLAAAAWLLPAYGAEAVLTARAPDYSAASRFGRFEVRAEAQGTIDLTVDGTSVTAEVYTGSKFTGAAAVYTQPVPRVPLRGVRAVSIGAAKVTLLEEPSRANGYRARLRVVNKELKLANVRLLWETDTRFNGTSITVAPSEPDNSIAGRMELTGRFANDVEFRVRGTEVMADGPFVLQLVRFTQPLPAQKLMKFAKRGKVEIVEPPDENNRYTATIRIRNVKPEAEDRKIELTWSR
jgi:hypothetical protein